MKSNSEKLLFAVDLIGTFVFGVEGAMAAVHADLDLLGVLVLAFATALGGGIIRDLLIGATPVGAIRDWRYSVFAFLGAIFVFSLHQVVREIPNEALILFDAAGLGLFAVSGAGKALSFGIHPFVAVLMGGITGVGGGTLRDILLTHVPTVLRADVYATAALAGAAIMVTGIQLRLNPAWMGVAGGVACFALRMVSVWEHWNLPRGMGH